jgi:hypothetical protein
MSGLRAEHNRKRFIMIGQFGMRGGGAFVGRTPAHLALTELAIGEIQTFSLFAHFPPERGRFVQVPSCPCYSEAERNDLADARQRVQLL